MVRPTQWVPVLHCFSNLLTYLYTGLASETNKRPHRNMSMHTHNYESALQASLVTPDGRKVPSGKDVFTQVGTKEFNFALQHEHCVNS